MMDRGRFKHVSRFFFNLVPVFISFSCATASTPDRIQQGAPEASPEILKDLKAELSSPSVTAGTIAWISFKGQSSGLNVVGSYEGVEIPFFPMIGNEYGAILAVPYDHAPGMGTIQIKVTQGEKVTELPLAVKVEKGKYPSEVLHVDGRRVNPNKKDLERILKEQAEVGEIYRKVTPKKYWTGPFVFPIQSKITSVFGTRRVYNGQLKNFHPGLDLKAPEKTPVHSAAPGMVVMAKELFYTGNTIMIDHGYGVITLYAHLSSMNVHQGDVVSPQQLLGLSGKTGRVNGPHLHWQAVVHHIKINPLGLIQVVR